MRPTNHRLQGKFGEHRGQSRFDIAVQWILKRNVLGKMPQVLQESRPHSSRIADDQREMAGITQVGQLRTFAYRTVVGAHAERTNKFEA